MTRVEVIEELKKQLNAKDEENANLKARIAELEAKLEPKTCDGCEYEDDKRGEFCYVFDTCCSREPRADHYTPKERR